jgi:hypothetical protein
MLPTPRKIAPTPLMPRLSARKIEPLSATSLSSLRKSPRTEYSACGLFVVYTLSFAEDSADNANTKV